MALPMVHNDELFGNQNWWLLFILELDPVADLHHIVAHMVKLDAKASRWLQGMNLRW